MAGSCPAQAQRARDAGAAGGGAVQGGEAPHEAAIRGDGAVSACKRRKLRASEGLGQIRIGQQPGRAGQGRAQVQAAGEQDEAEAQDAVARRAARQMRCSMARRG